MKKLPIEKISRKVFDSLPEYSISLPSGQIVGKVWKCNRNFYGGPGKEDWVICEYINDPDPNLIGIDYRKPEIIDEPGAPR